VTIRVSRNALKAHLRHGDTMGPCSAAKFTLCVKGKTTKVKGEKKAEKLLRKEAKLGKCKTKQKGKSDEKQKGKSDENKQKGKSKKDHGKPAENPGKGESGKPAETPGKGGEKGPKK
jgi:hypothetical protein